MLVPLSGDRQETEHRHRRRRMSEEQVNWSGVSGKTPWCAFGGFWRLVERGFGRFRVFGALSTALTGGLKRTLQRGGGKRRKYHVQCSSGAATRYKDTGCTRLVRDQTVEPGQDGVLVL